MKHHVKVKKYIEVEGEVDAVIAGLQEASAGLKEAYVLDDSWGGDPSYYVSGWRPMNEGELAAAKKQSAKERQAKQTLKQKQHEAELAEYERLKAKYGG